MSNSIVRKAVGSVEPSGEDRTARIVLTSEEPDRVGDVVRAGGVSLDNYKANPVLLLGHDHKCLIGKTSDWAVEPGRRITAKATFHEETEEARQAWRLVKMGYLNGVSIGFAPTSPPRPIAPTERTKGGWDYTAVELMEVSLTAVPAHPRALVLRNAVASGRLDGEKLSPVIRKSLREALRAGPRKKEKAMPATEPVAETKALAESGLPAGGATVAPEMGDPAAAAAPPGAGTGNDVAGTIGRLAEQIAELIALVKPAATPPVSGGPGDDTINVDSGGGDDLFGEEEEEEDGAEDEFDLGGEGEADEGAGEEEEDVLDRYRKAKKPSVKKASPAAVLKSMKAHAAVLKAATDHMGAMGEMAPGAAWGGMHQSACKYHHGEMTKMCKALEGDDDQGEPAAEGEAVPSEEQVKSLVAGAIKPQVDAIIYRITGRRVS